MPATPQDTEVETRSPGTGHLPLSGMARNVVPWSEHLEWGPGHMLNDMGPATVIVTPEDVAAEATALTVQKAVQRAIEKSEEYEYDE